MIYINRDENGKIKDIDFSEKEGYEKNSIFNEEIKQFIIDSNNKDLIKMTMMKLDLEMVRVSEDIVEILIQKGIMLFTDLPEAVQNKLLFKRFLRESLSSDDKYFMDQENIEF